MSSKNRGTLTSDLFLTKVSNTVYTEIFVIILFSPSFYFRPCRKNCQCAIFKLCEFLFLITFNLNKSCLGEFKTGRNSLLVWMSENNTMRKWHCIRYLDKMFRLIRRHYMAEILLIRRKTLSNQSINQSYVQFRGPGETTTRNPADRPASYCTTRDKQSRSTGNSHIYNTIIDNAVSILNIVNLIYIHRLNKKRPTGLSGHFRIRNSTLTSRRRPHICIWTGPS